MLLHLKVLGKLDHLGYLGHGSPRIILPTSTYDHVRVPGLLCRGAQAGDRALVAKAWPLAYIISGT